MGVHDALAERILAAIDANGADVTFVGGSDTAPVYDPLTDTWSGGEAGGDVVGKAVQTTGDPDRFQALGLVLTNPVTLMVAAKDLGVTPEPGMAFLWAGKQYTVKLSDPHGPSGEPLYYTMTGST